MRRNPILTSLMIAAIAVGIGVSMSMLSVYHILASNPIPDKSDQLFRVTLDTWGPLRAWDENDLTNTPTQVTYRDATALMDAAPASRQSAMFETGLVVEPDDAEQIPFEARARAAYSDFFYLFNVPFLYGGPWDKLADDEGAQVVVLTPEINNKLFGGEDSVGEKILMSDRYFTVTGVIDRWEPMPRFYDTINSPIQQVNEIFIPFTLTPRMELWSFASSSNWKAEKIQSHADWLSSEAIWIQYWAELKTEQEIQAYQDHLDNYAREQKKVGRFQRPINNRIFNVTDWLEYREVVPNEVKVLVALGFLFLVVCLLSSVGLLLTKFDGRSVEVCLRRALGATRTTLLGQHLMEVAVIGLVGGVFGIGLTHLCLLAIGAMLSQAPDYMLQMDWQMVSAAFAVAIITSVMAGLFPAWRSCMTAPAQALKTQ
jgi:putative ABC transport system permease protein